MTLDHHSSVADVEAALMAAGRLRGYARDDDFRRLIFSGMTLDAVRALADLLDSHSERGHCVKARVLRNYLDGSGYWSTPEGAPSLVAATRRTCCGCHETGSYRRMIRDARGRLVASDL